MQSIQCFANQIAGQANLHKLKENLQELPKRWLSRQEQQPSEEYLLGTVTGDCNYHFTFRLEGGGLFQTGVLVASAENGPGGVPVPLKCRWRRRMGDGTAVDIPGVTSNMYQISADDVGTHICVEAEPADAEDGMVGRVHGEIGPFELDPATRRNLDNALGQGGARFNVSQPQALGDASPAASKRQELAIHVSVDTVRVVPLQGGSERPAREMVVEYTPDLPKLIIHPLDTTKFQLILGEGRHFHLVAPSRTSRDMIVLTMRCFHARRQVSTQTILQQLLPVLPVDRSGGGVPTYGGALVPTNTDSKLDACIWLERVTKELNRAMQQKEISEKILRNTNSEKRQLQAQLVETISGFTEVIEGIQEQFGCETGLGMQTPTTSVELLQEQLREANAQNKVLQAETHSERAQLEKLIQANKAAPAAEAAAGNVQGLREEKQLLQMRLKELSVSSSHQTRDQADQVHAHELKRLRQDIEMLHNQTKPSFSFSLTAKARRVRLSIVISDMPRQALMPLHLLALSIALLHDFAAAWAPDGHERIARVAQDLLFGKHRDQIRSMMHSDVIDVADFEAQMTKQYPETDTLHWHRQEPEWTCGSYGGLGAQGHVRCDGHGAENGSLFCALAYFFEHFAHDLLLKEYPTPQEPIGTPENLPVLEKIPPSELKSSNYLRWLITLVGDLHQPLHWLHENNYGKDIKVLYKEEEYTLFSFWEEFLPKQLGPLNKVHPNVTDKQYGKETRRWSHKAPTELFRIWAKDMSHIVCTEIYAPMIINHADGTVVESPFTIDDEQFEKWRKLAYQIMSIAGERLSFVLNDIIEHKRHKEAHADGRALPSHKVAVGTEEVEIKREVNPDDPNDNWEKDYDLEEVMRQLKIEEHQRDMSNAANNLLIAVLLIPALLCFFRWHEKMGGGGLFCLVKRLKQ